LGERQPELLLSRRHFRGLTSSALTAASMYQAASTTDKNLFAMLATASPGG
jgi:hypothetical protein